MTLIAAAPHIKTIADRDRWNRFVESQETGNITQTYEWGELGHASGGRVLRLGASVNGELRAALLAVVERAPLLRRSYLYVPRGPVCDDPNSPALAALLAHTAKEARKLGAFMVKVEPNVRDGDTAWLAMLAKAGYQRSPFATHPRRSWVLDVTPSEEALLAAMKEKWRYNIRLAGKKGVTVRHSLDDGDIATFYRIYEETAKRDGIWIHPQEHYASFLKLYGSRDAARLFIAEHEGVPIACLIAARCGTVTTYMFGASSNQQRNRMPNHLLQWTAIRWAKENGSAVYDFRAIAEVLEPDEDMYSLYTYKSGFGGESYLALETHDLPLNGPVYWAYRQTLAVKRKRDRDRHLAEVRARAAASAKADTARAAEKKATTEEPA
ncbi:MAG TPA: peptidoglycan bridge formation glycyltransferase FemA/FemB family protein [Ktedonobacterales bacterium]